MNASGTLTCPRCGTETPWPNRCDCTPPSAGRAITALRELVRLKDLKDLIESDPSIESKVALLDDYEENKPKAWAAARAALSSAQSATLAITPEELASVARFLRIAAQREQDDTGRWLGHQQKQVDLAIKIEAMHATVGPRATDG
jgi:hypothetical protein